MDIKVLLSAIEGLTNEKKLLRDQGCCHVDYHTHFSGDIVKYLIKLNPNFNEFDILQFLSKESSKAKKERVIFKSKIGELYFLKNKS